MRAGNFVMSRFVLLRLVGKLLRCDVMSHVVEIDRNCVDLMELNRLHADLDKLHDMLLA